MYINKNFVKLNLAISNFLDVNVIHVSWWTTESFHFQNYKMIFNIIWLEKNTFIRQTYKNYFG